MCAGIKYGGWTEWDYCWQRYKETTLPDERLNFLRALAASNDPWILQQLSQTISISLFLFRKIKFLLFFAGIWILRWKGTPSECRISAP